MLEFLEQPVLIWLPPLLISAFLVLSMLAASTRMYGGHLHDLAMWGNVYGEDKSTANVTIFLTLHGWLFWATGSPIMFTSAILHVILSWRIWRISR